MTSASIPMDLSLSVLWTITDGLAMPSLVPTTEKVGGSRGEHSVCPVYAMITESGRGRSPPTNSEGPLEPTYAAILVPAELPQVEYLEGSTPRRPWRPWHHS